MVLINPYWINPYWVNIDPIGPIPYNHAVSDSRRRMGYFSSKCENQGPHGAKESRYDDYLE